MRKEYGLCRMLQALRHMKAPKMLVQHTIAFDTIVLSCIGLATCSYCDFEGTVLKLNYGPR